MGRGSGGRGHNKREQSALIGVCRERRLSYESQACQRVALRREVAALISQTRRYCTAIRQQRLSLLLKVELENTFFVSTVKSILQPEVISAVDSSLICNNNTTK